MRSIVKVLFVSVAVLCVSVEVKADENLFGYVRGVEVIPKGGWELYNTTTMRDDKDLGSYTAFDNVTEVEYGFSDRFNMSAGLQALAIDTNGLVINGYLPGAKDFGLKPSGIEVAAKYNILRPAADAIGLSLRYALDYSWIDKHSGQDKDTLSAEFDLLTQKYFMDGQMVWVGNLGLEMTYADRGYIDILPEYFEWPTDPEMEVEIKLGTGLSYRFAPNWFIGAEALYETEFETEVGQERWSIFAGPSLHYGSAKWWGTLTWLPQIVGGGEQYDGQADDSLHLIEKTKQEFRLKLGYNF
jgi:hypothetical protein